jgi:16S rRNA (cytosine1402-N4)-methyltransferase
VSSDSVHVPVLVAEVVEALQPAPGRVIVDCTLGGGGHAEALLEAGAAVVGIDRDPAALEASRRRLARFGERLRLVHGRFADLRRLLDAAGVDRADGLVADLGLSSVQLADAARGFSFRAGGPPLMSMGLGTRPASWWVNEAPEEELARVIRAYGEERRAGRIAAAIVDARPVETAAELADVVARAQFRGARARRERIHPATRTFQALRIAANDELDELDALLGAFPEVLAAGGRAAVIAYHSLEDRRVKIAFRDLAGAGWRLVTRRVVRPSAAEAAANPRARSARLRAIEAPALGADR